MTKKDFKAIAAILQKVAESGGDRDTIDRIVDKLVVMFAQQNPLFVEKLFREACLPKSKRNANENREVS